ncbi:MAG: response regulator, partial [Armatimonadetes bacterium]|nr:response regulator [Armatimonadota bacterium]
MAALLRRLLGETVALELDLPADLGTVSIDPGQLEQVLMNLTVNARDAMPEGGRLRIATRREDVADIFDQLHPGREPGRYVVLSVADDGLGMDAGTRERIFEPFFTTKGRSQGTGLGLATCYGIIKQCGGFIECDSTPGRGSVFSIFLPATDRPPSHAPAESGDESPARGHESILMVEDDDGVRAMTKRALEAAGYRVTEAPDAAHALAAAETTPVDLLLTDVVMPGMDGATLATQLREKLPGLRVVLMSGYAESNAVREVLSSMPAGFLAKPFTTSLLTQRVREVL